MHTLNILTHIAAGCAALALGLFPLLTAKGSRWHRFTGWLFVAAGTLVLGCAVIGITFFPQPAPLIMATLSASYQFIGGLRALKRVNHLDTVMALATLGACVWLALNMHNANASWPPMIGYSILGFLSTITLYDLSRPLWRAMWARMRHIDHGLKMTGAYFAMASAGLGNLWPAGQPWSQLAPSLIGLVVMVLLLGIHLSEKRQMDIAE